MKKLIFIIFITGFFTLGCEKYLTEENPGNVVAEEFYLTEAGYESLVNTCYSQLRAIYGKAPWMFCAGTDLYVEGRNPQPEGLSQYRNLTPEDTIVRNFYFNCYHAIQMCNTALYYNNITENTDVLTQRKGEVEFLRAYFYFLLVQTYGGVAISNDMIDAPKASFDQNTAEEVYAQITSDLKNALELVPEYSGSFNGRVDKRAVRHYLAKVYLTRGYELFGTSQDFTDAASYADAAINNQSLNISFGDIFFPGNELNEEVIFSVQYDPASITAASQETGNLTWHGNWQNGYFGPYHGGEGAIYGYPWRSYNLCPDMELFDLFTQEDTRFDGTFMINIYGNFEGSKYIGTYYDYYTKKDDRASLNIAYYYAPKWAPDTAAWRTADLTHRSVTIIYPYSPDWEASRTSNRDNETPAIKKFDDPKSEYATNIGTNTRDLFLARLGETYLIAAEAYLKSGDMPKAVARINEVRGRAAVSGADLTISAGELDIDFILDERARELAGEYHRWFDLKRTGKLMERAKLYNKDIKSWVDNGIDPFLGTDGNYKILRPIPQAAIDLNKGNYKQNPGY